MPLLPWKALFGDRFSRIACFGFISAIAIVALIDYQAYQNTEWQAYNDLNPVRALFTDFGAGEKLKNRPDILSRHGYTANDIDLIQGWFFVDQKLANVQALQSMLSEYGPIWTQTTSLKKAMLGVSYLWSPALLTFLLIAVFVALLRPSWRVVASWGLFIAAIFLLGLMGRPGVFRVYLPVVFLLLISPFFVAQVFGWRKYLVAVSSFLAAIVIASSAFTESKRDQVFAEQIRKDFSNFPTDTVVIWGGVLPFESLYPVLKRSPSVMSYRLYGLGCSALAPFSVSFTETELERNITNRLVQDTGVPIIASDQQLGLLAIYCKEHFHGHLKELSTKHFGNVALRWYRCDVTS